MNKSCLEKKKMPVRLRRYIQNKLPKQPSQTRIEEKKTQQNQSFDFRIITDPSFCLDVVYFANLFVNPSFGPRLIREQLSDLVATGITRFCRIHIVLSVPPDFDYVSLQESLTFLFQKQFRTLEFHIGDENCHEYPGIQLVHALASANGSPNHFLLYFHSKGISRFHGRRERVELALHKTVIAQWKHVLEIFSAHPIIDKIGSSASTGGWIWWNYWWARASYLAQVETPVKTERRHYYEDWLCRVFVKPEEHIGETHVDREENCFKTDLYHHTVSNCWSLSLKDQPIGEGCDPADAYRLLIQGLR